LTQPVEYLHSRSALSSCPDYTLPQPAHPGQHQTRFYSVCLLTLGIMMPETWWVNLKVNKHLYLCHPLVHSSPTVRLFTEDDDTRGCGDTILSSWGWAACCLKHVEDLSVTYILLKNKEIVH